MQLRLLLVRRVDCTPSAAVTWSSSATYALVGSKHKTKTCLTQPAQKNDAGPGSIGNFPLSGTLQSIAAVLAILSDKELEFTIL